MVKIFGLAILGISLVGCIKPLNPDTAELQSVSTAPRTIPDCAGCHAYPLTDVNHQYHMRSYNTRNSLAQNTAFNRERQSGVIICMDCHLGSIAHRPYLWFDTIWADANGDPIPLQDHKPGDKIFRVDTIPGFLPLPSKLNGREITSPQVEFMLDSAAKFGQLVQWMTAKKHMNDSVDVQFSSSIVPDSAQRDTAYNPKDFSCSNIECHNSDSRKKVYRWGSADKKLTSCPTVLHTPEIDSSCRYSPTQEGQ